MIDPLTSTAFAVHSGKGIYALLLGSGISRPANIPTGWEVTLDLIRRIAATLGEIERCSGDPQEWYRERFGSDPGYSDLLEQLALSAAERTTALARYFEGTTADEEDPPQPTAAHIAIAKMVKRGYIRVILTTNFDRLMERALENEGVSPAILSTPDAIQGSIPLAHASCVVIKLHGDYRDARLRNTIAELSEYDSQTQLIVDQVLNEYGLIVSGWSATWDVALRKSITRSPNRRFSTMWTYVSELSVEAEELIQLRQAQKIAVVSADMFFTNLNEKLEALESFDAPHPLSTDLSIRTAKKYLAEDRFRIQFHDLLMAEVDHVLSATKELSMRAEISPDLYLKRLQLYEAAMERLLPVLVNAAYWGTESSLPVIVGTIERLMTIKSQFGGFNNWVDLQLYPAALAFYSAGLGFLAANNYRSFANLTRNFDTGAGEMNNRVGSAIERLGLQGTINKDALNAAIGQTQYVPYSERVNGLLSAVFAKQLPSVNAFDDLFDRCEYLGALVVADLRLFRGEHSICGWFGRFVHRNTDFGVNISELLKKERDRLGDEWAPIKAQVFESSARFDEVVLKHNTDCMSRVAHISYGG